MANIDLFRNDRNNRNLWNAWDAISRDFNSFFQDFDSSINAQRGGAVTTFSPAVDIEESEKAFHLSFDVPGFKQDDLNIDLSGRLLTVSGKRSRSTVDQKLHRSEKSYGEFRRSFSLPDSIKVDAIQADYEHGILNLTLPKAELAKTRKIEIGAFKGDGGLESNETH